MRISDWSSDVCSSDLVAAEDGAAAPIAADVPADAHGEMVGSVAGRRLQPDMIVEFMVAADQFRALGGDDRQEAVGQVVDRRLCVLLMAMRRLEGAEARKSVVQG